MSNLVFWPHKTATGKNNMEKKIISTADGSNTLFLPALNEQYHSMNGALSEANYVFRDKGYRSHPSPAPRIFEVGFGTGLNALVTALEATSTKRNTHFTSIENCPLSLNEVQALGYGHLISEEAVALFEKLHNANWDCDQEINAHFTLHKVKASLPEYRFATNNTVDVVYFDAFGPDKQPEMWTPEIFGNIYRTCSPGAILVTYSAKGTVRRCLQHCGFTVERLPGPPGKRQMLRGKK